MNCVVLCRKTDGTVGGPGHGLTCGGSGPKDWDLANRTDRLKENLLPLDWNKKTILNMKRVYGRGEVG